MMVLVIKIFVDVLGIVINQSREARGLSFSYNISI